MTPEYGDRFEQAKFFRSTPVGTNRVINRIVIHVTDANTTNSTVNYFKDPKKNGQPVQVSAHFVIGQDGEVVQMVAINDVAFHAGSANGDSIGIEHVAVVPKPTVSGILPTAVEYEKSAMLVQWLCEKFTLSQDRVHILGHNEADPGTSHISCPTGVWSWSYYMDIINNQASSSVTPPPPDLQIGSNGEYVQKLQQTLIALSNNRYNPSTPDGNFGSNTETAVKNYQVDNNLPDTGVVDWKTWGILGY